MTDTETSANEHLQYAEQHLEDAWQAYEIDADGGGANSQALFAIGSALIAIAKMLRDKGAN